MKYYFLPGRYFDLSKAEILSVIGQYISKYEFQEIDSKFFVVDTSEPVDTLFKRLGGFLSYGVLVENFSELYEGLDEKIVFGINGYGKVNVKEMYEQIKDELKAKGISAKYPLAKSNILNAGQIIKNKLLEKGFVLEIIETSSETYFGKCLGVQNIDQFSRIEYEKPFTDNKVGVLPAKLSRMLINLSGVKPGDTVWDPFCGSGTILLEGYEMGINVIGSDASPKAVEMANANVEWLGKELNEKTTKFNIFRFDILRPDTKVTSLLRNTEINAVVCEPFMGPPQLKTVSLSRAKQLLETVVWLYGGLFRILERSKLGEFRIVLILPSYKTNKGWVSTSLSEIVGKKWEIENKKFGGVLHWERENSIIRRNIFIVKKKF